MCHHLQIYLKCFSGHVETMVAEPLTQRNMLIRAVKVQIEASIFIGVVYVVS